ncbi:hypothetical protein GALL_453030 [mine drainage metagenome]|uniref:Methyltransferase type 11 domain-containing protein n=1 Tax=mine drainage metagenome TaxID=410659 RepID=A0A1J5PNB5_9ZZZZ
MAINTVTIDWLLKLQSEGVIGHDETMLELGPQDLMAALPHVMGRLQHLDRAGVDINAVVENGGLSPSSQKILYAALGIGRYFSSDIADPRADFRIDLNQPVQSHLGTFDLITNFGTAEHVFNIAQVFMTIHQLLKDGGVVLHILPALGDCNHGFWNIHPTVYFDIARENGYEILDYQYMDNAYVRWFALHQTEGLEAMTSRFDFSSLPVKIQYSNRQAPFQAQNPQFTAMAAAQYLNNATDPDTQRHLRQNPTLLFDYSYVAMRKLPSLGQSAFKYPSQSMYIKF